MIGKALLGVARRYYASSVLVFRLALQNLAAGRARAVLTGLILFGCAFLVVVGSAFVESVDRGMERSVTDSVSGDLQVYSARSREPLELIDTVTYEGPDLAELDWPRLKRVLAKLPNIARVVPMGVGGAAVPSRSTIDVALDELRLEITRSAKAASNTNARAVEESPARQRVRRVISVLSPHGEQLERLNATQAISDEDLAALRRASSDDFWRHFDDRAMENLELLENRVAPHVTDSQMLFLRYIGTDPQLFAQAFERFHIVRGRMIPRGRRGILFEKSIYERQMKLKTARRFDRMRELVDTESASFASHPELARMVEENVSQSREILLELDSAEERALKKQLQVLLGTGEQDIAALLKDYLRVSDENFEQRYDFFYAKLAPLLQLYRVRVGDVLVIRSFTRTGHLTSVGVPVWGVFEFRGLEDSPLAANLNLIDLVSFRELAGFSTAVDPKELAQLRAEMNVQSVSREDAEAVLFSGSGDSMSQAAPPVTALEAHPNPATTTLAHEAALAAGDDAVPIAESGRSREQQSYTYDPALLKKGVVLNAAVFLRDTSRAEETAGRIREAGRAEGLQLKVISWREAAGLVGQFVLTLRGVLYAGALVILLVALIILGNALLMSTLERVAEFGTLRAIGAQRRLVMAMIIAESALHSSIFGCLGAGAGGLLVLYLAHHGVHAPNDTYRFFFAGDTLYPRLLPHHLLVALGAVLCVSVLAALYPALHAMRVTPRRAMQGDE